MDTSGSDVTDAVDEPTRPTAGTPRQTSTTLGSSVPRSPWLVVAAIVASALLGAVAAVGVTSALDRGRWEQAVIGLTDESEWPMHDVHLATAAGQLDDPSLVDQVRSERGLGSDVIVQLDRERQSGSGTLTISARARSAETAADVANAVAERVVASVPEGTPIRLVDRANASPSASAGAIALSGGFVGLLIGVLVWTPASFGRRLARWFRVP